MPKRTKKKTHPIRTIFLLALLLLAIGCGTLVYSFDINSYRGAIEQAVNDQTGRALKLAGPLKWSLSWTHGFSLSVNDVSFSNPSWASRKEMAKIGSARLHLDITALVRQQIRIIAFEISKADVQLETAANGAVNWTFEKDKTASEKKDPEISNKETQTETTSPVKIKIDEITILDSRFAIKSADGKTQEIDVPELTLQESRKGVSLRYKGTITGAPVEITLTGSTVAEIGKSKWPFVLKASYDALSFTGRGSLSETTKTVSLESYGVAVGDSDLSGNMQISLGGARPSLKGKMESKHLAPSDFSLGDGASTEAADKKGTTQKDKTDGKSEGKIFSHTPLALEGLKAVDASFDIKIDELTTGLTTAKQVAGKIDLQDGRLTIAPFQANVGGSKADFSLKLDASSPEARMSASLKAPSLDLSQLFKMGGMESAISGKTDVDIDITSSGRSPRDMAAHANGKINLLMDTGTVSSSMLKEIAGGLVDLFAPGIGSLTSPGVNCMAARYIITNGLMESKGMLLDTEMTTIAGTGYVNLADEHISMSLFTRPKAVGLSSMIPPTRIIGDLSNPKFTLDAAGTAQKIVGLLTNGSTSDAGVPNLVTGAGKNVCAATLDTPNTSAPTKPLVPSDLSNVHNAVKDVGSKLMKGLFGN